MVYFFHISTSLKFEDAKTKRRSSLLEHKIMVHLSTDDVRFDEMHSLLYVIKQIVIKGRITLSKGLKTKMRLCCPSFYKTLLTNYPATTPNGKDTINMGLGFHYVTGEFKPRSQRTIS